MYFRFRGCPVMLDVELYVSAWYHKTRCALYRCEVSSAAAASGSRQQRSVVCVVRHNFQNYMQYGAETKERFCANRNTKRSRVQHKPTSKSNFLIMESPCIDMRAGPTRKVIGRTPRLCNPQNTHAPLRQDRGCQNTSFYVPLSYVCRSVLSREHWRMALSKLGKFMFERTRRIGQAVAVLSYYTDQLMTPCSKYFSGGSTLKRYTWWG